MSGGHGTGAHDGTGPAIAGIVLAGGSGARFGESKQFTRVAGHRLVDLALRAVAPVCDHLVLVLPAGRRWDGPAVDAVVEAGRDRTASVRAGLTAVPMTAEIVVIHQAANPLATTATVQRVVDAVHAGADAAVPGLRVPDVVARVADGRLVEDVGRDDLVLIQTPGAFRASVLRAAHAGSKPAIEDTALIAASGGQVTIVPGDAHNIHVTSPDDLRLVARLFDPGPDLEPSLSVEP